MISGGKKILFYTANGVGLGHLRRTTLIAEAMRRFRPDLDIHFITLAPDATLLKKKKFSYQQLACLTDNVLESRRLKEVKDSNERKIVEYLQRQKPDALIADMHPDGFSFSGVLLQHRFAGINKFFIYRLGDRKSARSFFAQETKITKGFNTVVIPHTLADLERVLGKRQCNKIVKNKKFTITGPIVGTVSGSGIKKCRRKYGITGNMLVVTITFGGGGGHAGKCENPDRIITTILGVLPLLKKKMPGAKMIMVTGPFSTLDPKKLSGFGMRVVRYEDNLLELMSLSDVVVASAGYNTCNELILTRTPAVLIPLLRGDKEQFERARYLQSTGAAIVLKKHTAKEIVEKIVSCADSLDTIKSALSCFDIRADGVSKAAQLILSKL